MKLLAHKIRIFPTPEQEEYFNKSCGIARFTYNNALVEWKRMYEDGEKPCKFKLITWFSKEFRPKYDWMKDVSSRVARNAIDNVDKAFQNFFKNRSSYPRFKKKGKSDSFAIREKEKFKVVGTKLKIEKLPTWIQMEQRLRFDGTTKQVTISKKANRWYASILVETNSYSIPTKTRKPIVGVDLGIKELATLSNGEVYKNSKPLRSMLKKLAKLQKQFAKKIKGSNRWKRLKLRIQKLHLFITFKRRSVLHKLSDYLTKSFDIIVLEDLNVSGMIKNHKLALAISDVGFYELKRQVDYKAKLRNNFIIIADRWFPSSKTCSKCGFKKDKLLLSERIFQCEACNASLDRDLNAAVNLMDYGRQSIRGDLKRTEKLLASKSNSVDNVNFENKYNGGYTVC